MNKIYFVRHAKPDFTVHDDLTRPLTEEGINDSKRLTKFFKDKGITKMYSSPYKRSIDTIRGISEILDLEIELVHDFRERKISDEWIEDFKSYAEKQWEDFEYKLEGGESLREVQERNIKQLHKILEEHTDQAIVIGTHGTALSTILNYYDNTFKYISFQQFQNIMPWVVCLEFDGNHLLKLEYILGV